MLEQEVEVSRSPSKYRARRLASWLRTRLSWHQTPTRSRGGLAQLRHRGARAVEEAQASRLGDQEAEVW